MREITDQHYAAFVSTRSEHLRVMVKDAGGTFVDLSSYPRFDAVVSASWGESIGEPHMTADVVVAREMFAFSLNPMMQASALNHGFVVGSAYAPLLALAREFTIDVAVTAADRLPQGSDWIRVFHGRIDSINPAAGDRLRFGGRDLAGRLADQQIKKERIYSYAQVAGLAVSLRPWEPGMTVAVGEYMLPASRGANDPGFNKFFLCDVAGTTGNTEPQWTTGANQTDGTARWDYAGAPTSLGRPVEQVIQNILDDSRAAGDSAVSLYVPSSPGWAIREFQQSRVKCLEAVRALAQQIGWDARMKWRAATSQFEFTLWEPERTKVDPEHSFSTRDYCDPTKLETDIANIRNKWTVIYSDASDRWPDGSAKRKSITVESAPSIAQYGEMFAEIQESSASNIADSTSAARLVNAALSDCAEPIADVAVSPVFGFPWVELGDLYEFDPGPRHFDFAQKFAVVRYSHSFEAGALKTELVMRGKPALSPLAWIDWSTATAIVIADVRAMPSESAFTGPVTSTPAVTSTPGGLELSIIDDSTPSRADVDYEVHLSTSPDFTPDESTLAAVIKDKRIVIASQRPGSTLYGKTVPRQRQRGRIARGQPSAEFDVSPGYVGAGLLDRLATNEIPNSDFEAVFGGLDPAPTVPPDHWQLSAGTWGPSGDAYVGTTAARGNHIALRQTGTNAIVYSEIFRIPLGAPSGTITAAVRPQGTLSSGRDLQFHIDFYADPYGSTPTGDYDLAVPYNHTAANVWGEFTDAVPVPAESGYARVSFYKTTVSSAYGWDVARVDLRAV